MTVTHGDQPLAGEFEGRSLSETQSCAVQSIVPTGSASSVIAHAASRQRTVSFRTVRRASDFGQMWDFLFAPLLDDQDGSDLVTSGPAGTLTGACLTSAQASHQGLLVTVDWSFLGQ